MKQSLLQEKYPVFTLEVDKRETVFRSVDEIVGYLRTCIEEHRSARFIAVFDHYAHTKGLAEGYISNGILAAKNIVFCFGLTLPEPRALALRPRSIGVAETQTGFLITFMEAPMPIANQAIEEWAKAIRNDVLATEPDSII
jgi:hypothetical protein